VPTGNTDETASVQQPAPAATVQPARPRTRRRRRLRQPAPRTKRVCPRFSDSEYEEITRAAEAADGMEPGGYVAEAALSAARADNPQAAVADHRRAVQELMASNRQVAAVGNNLNQLAHYLNAGGTLPEAERVQNLLDHIEDALDDVDEAIESMVRR
jgi:hypothetical protein